MGQGVFGHLDDRYREYAKIIQDSGDHLLNMINQVLDIAKIDAGRLTLQEEEMDIADAISACARLMACQMDRKKIVLSQSIAAQMPRLYADPRVFRQIVLNLLGNAMKFTPEGGQVRISAETGERGLSLAVSDLPIRIAAADLPRVFDRFGQVDNAYTRSHTGTGLGLPLVKEFVEAHQGGIAVDSVLEEGTIVVITLPAARRRSRARAASAAA